MLSHLADVSIRSLLLLLPATVVLLILPSRRTAALQHAVGTAVVCGMLVLFAFGQTLPRLPLRILSRTAAAFTESRPIAASNPAILDEAPAAVYSAPAVKPRRTISWSDIAVFGYCAIVFALLARFATGMLLARRLISRSTPCPGMDGVYQSERVAVPFTIGWLRPRILLPPAWREWDRRKLDAVLAHEGAHARRHDGLVAALAALNRCLLWFHPLAWMLERKLALLAEQACDESCVAAMGDRRRYASLLLEMAMVVDGSQGRMRSHALTMAAASHIRRRIDSLLEDGRTFSRGLTRAGWAAVALCGIPLVWSAGAVDLDRQAPVLVARPSAPAPSLPQQIPVPQKPAVLAQAQAASAPTPKPQPPADTRPKFDVVSVKPCQPGDGAGRSGRGGGGGRGFGTSSGRLWVTCLSLQEMMDIAYGQFGADRLLNDRRGINGEGRFRGNLPAWASTDYYSVEAQTDNPVANGPADRSTTPGGALMDGPMFQTLLEERFKVKLHRETEEVAMYALTVAKAGLKMKPMEAGGCRPHDPSQGTMVGDMFPPGQKPMCVQWTHFEGPNWVIDGAGQTLAQLAGGLNNTMDHYVLDRTAINDVFSYHLVFAHDDKTPGHFPAGMRNPFPESDIPPGQSIFSALDQFGLKLESIKGPHEFYVMDHVERPTEN